MSTLWAFNNVGNKHSLYRGEDCMKKFWISLRENAADAINFEKKKMFPLTEKELKSHQVQPYVTFAEKIHTRTCLR